MNARYPYLLALALTLPLSSCRFVGLKPDFSVMADSYSPVEPDTVVVESAPPGFTPLAEAPRPAQPVATPRPAPKPMATTPATAQASRPSWFSTFLSRIYSAIQPTPSTDARGTAQAPAMAVNGIYTVRPGDSLARIARIHGISLNSLASANGIDLQKPLIKPGQQLRIPKASPRRSAAPKPAAQPAAAQPAAPAAAPATVQAAPAPVIPAAPAALQATPAPAVATAQPAAPTPAAPAAAPTPGQYRVAQGDTPYQIARKHNISLQDLLRANNLNEESARNLRIGTLLTIPTSQP